MHIHMHNHTHAQPQPFGAHLNLNIVANVAYQRKTQEVVKLRVRTLPST